MPKSLRDAGPGNRTLICLIGFMGAGKTAVGRELAALQSWDFIDLDQAIEEFERTSIAEIFSRSGLSAFRESETAALKKVLAEHPAPLVLALGGGAFAKEENQQQLRAAGARIFFLDAPLDELWQRVSQEGRALRPLLSDRASFDALYASRLPHFRQGLRVETGGRDADAVARQIKGLLEREG